MNHGSSPFVLLDAVDGAGRAALLYRDPVEIIETRQPEEIRSCLDRLAAAAGRSLHAAGYLSYECGHALEAKLAPLRHPSPDQEPPLLWFGLFAEAEGLTKAAVDELLPLLPVSVAPPRPLVARAAYEQAFAQVKHHIAAGDSYQINLTFPAEVRFSGAPADLYATLRRRSSVAHGGLLFTGSDWILSLSPELFFTIEEGTITARPMKGTAPRSSDPDEDRLYADSLAADPKQQAENLMIVDLLRNDLSRVSNPGSVRVETLFAIETYPTVHQMTSTVIGQVQADCTAVDVLSALFPCGSVTGAPKIRAMEIIAELERRPRRIYTGSIGRLAPGGEASFNVAIRTLSVRDGSDVARLGLGSGVVADSRADEEWAECLAKGGFVSSGTERFDLIESMIFDPHDGILNLERHLARMKASAEALGFLFDRHDTRNELQAATFRIREPKKLRLLLSRSGAIAIEGRPLPDVPQEPVAVALVPLPLPPEDFRLRHKTSDRTAYEEARHAAGTYEVAFVDAEGFLTEGSFTSIFVERSGQLLTPPMSRPLLPGVLRARLIEDGQAQEADLRAEDLADGFLIGNAVRGLIEARLA